MASDRRATGREPEAGRGRGAPGLVAATAVWAVAHGSGALGPLEPLTFVLLGGAALAATVVGVRRHRPAIQWPWWVICGALLLFLVGGGARVAFDTLGNLSETRRIVPDLLTLPGYLLLAYALTGFVRARRQGAGGDFDAVLDGAVAALAVLTFAWVLFINPVLFHEHAPVSVRLLLASYPPLSVFLVAVTTQLAFHAGARPSVAHRYLLGAMGFMLLGDTVYMFVDANLASVPRSLLDLPYALAFVGFIAVVLHPSMRDLCTPVRPRASTPTRPRLAFVAVALAVPAVVVAMKEEAVPGDRIAFAAIILALTGTAIWRVLRALRAHARAEETLAHQATHDVLTDLPNRVFLRDHISHVLPALAGRGTHLALLFLDVDRFKLVNDTFGHSLGDDLLVAVAERLCKEAGPGNLVARIGGDEFVLLLPDALGLDDALALAERVRRSFQAPFTIRGAEIYSSASLGVAFTAGRDPSVDAEALIRDADTAMYHAKAAGRDGVSVFDGSMRARTAERLVLERDLHHALERQELHLEFQPIVSLPGGRPEAVEALLRWTHPVRGSIPPATFVPVAEDTGLIVELGSWVLKEACRQAARWRREIPGAAHLRVAVNLSPRQVRDPSLVETVLLALAENALPPQALWLELTENLLMDNPAAASALLATLRRIGVGLSIDDFGTGYSSLAYLQRFPVDRVKIDRAFVEGLDRDDSSEESLVAAIVAMTGALGLTTIAEGVETLGQEARLRHLGCDLAQGYLYARPLPPADVPEALGRLVGARPLTAVTEG